MDRVLLPFPAQQSLARSLAPALKARIGKLDLHRFPDGESLVTVDPSVAGADVAIVASLDRPDTIALAVRFAAATARELGARSVGLVAPYMAYLRQDKRFHPGEALSAAQFAYFLAESADWIATIDPHLHRTVSLTQWFDIPTATISAAPVIADWIQAHVTDALLIGPDAESEQWVSEIAKRAGVPYRILEKARHGDQDVELSCPLPPLPQGRTPVLVDDIISSGRTQLAALKLLQAQGLTPGFCVATHAVFAGDALGQLQNAGAAGVVTTDTIPHETNAIGVAAMLATPVADMFQAIETGFGDQDESVPDGWFAGDEPTP